MRATALLEILEDAAIQLQHMAKALRLHVGTSLLATDTAGAEHHDGLLLQLRWQARHRSGEVAEVINACSQCILEGAQLHLVVVAGVEQGQRPPLVQPRLQLPWRQLR
jgi:hypothetical protein